MSGPSSQAQGHVTLVVAILAGHLSHLSEDEPHVFKKRQGALSPDCNRNSPLKLTCFRFIFEPVDPCFGVLPSRMYPGVLPEPIHLGPQRAHDSPPTTPPPMQLSPVRPLHCHRHQGLLKPQREVIPECY